jgi:hypothetical protein
MALALSDSILRNQKQVYKHRPLSTGVIKTLLFNHNKKRAKQVKSYFFR